MRTVVVYGPPVRRRVTLDELMQLAGPPRPGPQQQAEPPPRSGEERRAQVRRLRDVLLQRQPVPGLYEMPWLIADELGMTVGKVRRHLRKLDDQEEAEAERRRQEAAQARREMQAAAAAAEALRKQEQRQAAALRRYLTAQRRPGELASSRPVAQSDKHVRHRTGRDDHLELGVFVRQPPRPVPVFPVKVTRREPSG